jgi:transcriptional regulator with XRE-family HTH domain
MNAPTPEDLRTARLAAGLTQRQAGELIHSARSWEAWESGRFNMHPALLELFLLKTGQKALEVQTGEQA